MKTFWIRWNLQFRSMKRLMVRTARHCLSLITHLSMRHYPLMHCMHLTWTKVMVANNANDTTLSSHKRFAVCPEGVRIQCTWLMSQVQLCFPVWKYWLLHGMVSKSAGQLLTPGFNAQAVNYRCWSWVHLLTKVPLWTQFNRNSLFLSTVLSFIIHANHSSNLQSTRGGVNIATARLWNQISLLQRKQQLKFLIYVLLR